MLAHFIFNLVGLLLLYLASDFWGLLVFICMSLEFLWTHTLWGAKSVAFFGYLGFFVSTVDYVPHWGNFANILNRIRGVLPNRLWIEKPNTCIAAIMELPIVKFYTWHMAGAARMQFLAFTAGGVRNQEMLPVGNQHCSVTGQVTMILACLSLKID